MQKLSEALSRDGDPCPFIVVEGPECRGILKYVNVIIQISRDKNEPAWMLKKRLEALKLFQEMPMPNFGPDLSDLDIDDISLFIKPQANKNARSWSDVPADIKNTY